MRASYAGDPAEHGGKGRATCSVDPLAGSSGVHLLESEGGALVEDTLGLEALVLVVTVGSHACAEGSKVKGAELLQDVLAWGEEKILALPGSERAALPSLQELQEMDDSNGTETVTAKPETGVPDAVVEDEKESDSDDDSIKVD